MCGPPAHNNNCAPLQNVLDTHALRNLKDVNFANLLHETKSLF
jgi:hypothetical protein